MMDYYLKFATQVAAEAALFEGEGKLRRPRYAAVDVIGTIYKPTGKTLKAKDMNGNMVDVPEMKPVPGYHANVRHPQAAPELDEFTVLPVTPERVWL